LSYSRRLNFKSGEAEFSPEAEALTRRRMSVLGIHARALLWVVKVDLTAAASFFVDFGVFSKAGVHTMCIKCTCPKVLRGWPRLGLYLDLARDAFGRDRYAFSTQGCPRVNHGPMQA
jgi:hypothetical protein